MCCQDEDIDIYNSTIDSSKQMSINKAVAIMLENQEKNKSSIVRPNIKPHRGIIKILSVLLLFGSMCFILRYFNISLLYAIIFFLIIVVIKAKKTIVWAILLYQKYAPERIRRSCVYEPTCSNYMLIAIEKYGLVKGMLKGIKRLFKCHPPNGGIDNP